MSLRFKIFVLPALAIAAAVALVAVGSERYARRQFQQAEEQRTQTLVAQFERELGQRGDEVARAVQSVADAEATLRMALDLTRSQADPSVYANDARGLANIYHLDYLELTTDDGTLISSSHWAPASGYRNDWVAAGADWSGQGGFLSRVQLPTSADLGLLAVRAVRVGERNLYVIGGWRFDHEFLRSIALPEGMHALLYTNLESRFVPEALYGPEGPVPQPEQFAPIVEALQRGAVAQQTMQSFEQGSPLGRAETFTTVPLKGRSGELLAGLLVGSSQGDVASLVTYIRSLGLLATGLGILFSLVLSWRVSARVSRPLAQLAVAARDLQAGKWTHQPALRAKGEIGGLATALNDLSGQIARDRERLVQRERVVARREMARRFSREVKESIFPLHMAAEDMVHAREETSERFDEIFFECTTAMRAELDRLKNVAVRFGEFGRAPRPRPVPVNVNEIARAALQSVEPYFHTAGRPPVTPEVHLGEPDPAIEADPDLLRAALENLLLHCLDAMPSGGTLAIRTREKDSLMRIEVSAKGASFSAEDCQRLFVPTGSTPEGMSGLGLATAHAVVNDHGGRISAESAGDGSVTIRLEFSAGPAVRMRLQEMVRKAPQENAQLTTKEKVRPALPPAPVASTPEASGPAGPTEPVQVTVVSADARISSGEIPTAAETSTQREEPPSITSRGRRGLLFTE